DGRTDLVGVFQPDYNWSGGGVSVMLGNGDGTFQNHNLYGEGNTGTLGDVNGDGRLDFVTTNPGANITGDSGGVVLNDGVGSFHPFQTFTVGVGPTSLVVRDFNGDGFAEVAVGRPDADVVSVLVNDGNWPPNIPDMYVNNATVTEGHTGTRD